MTAAPASEASFPVRTPEFRFDGDIPHHWMNGNSVATQVFNGLNLVFPEGERFFINAVRDCAKGSELSPQLKREFVRYTAGTAASSEYRNVRP